MYIIYFRKFLYWIQPSIQTPFELWKGAKWLKMRLTAWWRHDGGVLATAVSPAAANYMMGDNFLWIYPRILGLPWLLTSSRQTHTLPHEPQWSKNHKNIIFDRLDIFGIFIIEPIARNNLLENKIQEKLEKFENA